MIIQSVLEKLELKDERSMLIQGLPSSIEKQFAKLSYAKNVTPLLKSKKVDFALIFAVSQNQLVNILKDIFQATHENSKLWIAFPKQTSKIVSDLNRDSSWDFLGNHQYESVNQIVLDHVWSAMLFMKETAVKPVPKVVAIDEFNGIDFEEEVELISPIQLEKAFSKKRKTKEAMAV